jgi:hypothetical protein
MRVQNSKEIDSIHSCTRTFEEHVKGNEFCLKPSNYNIKYKDRGGRLGTTLKAIFIHLPVLPILFLGKVLHG